MSGPAEQALIRGLDHLQRAQEAVAHNLANATTTAYKRRTVVATGSASFAATLDAAIPTQHTRSQLGVDHTAGALQPTGDRHHLAIDGDAFFAVRDPSGRTVLTRRGELVLDGQGTLRNQSGAALLSQDNQTLDLGDAQDWTIAPDGTVRGRVGGVETLLGQIGLFQVDQETALEPLDAGRFAVPQHLELRRAPPADATVRQGYTELSNVDAMLEMVQMIGVQRGFEAQSKALGTLHRLNAAFAADFDR